MTITETTQSTSSRVARRIAVAGGAAAIAAVAFAGAASAAPPPPTNTYEHSSSDTFVSPLTGRSTKLNTNFAFNVPNPGNSHIVLGGGAVLTTTSPSGKKTQIGGGVVVDINPAHPLKPTVLVSNSAATTRFGGLGGTTVRGLISGSPFSTRIPGVQATP